MSLKTRLAVNFGAELPNALLGRYCNEKRHVLWLKFWGLISMTNILWLWWSQHLNPELSNVLVRGIYELQQHKAAELHEMKELPGDTGSVSKGQVWLCHHADWLTYTAWLWLHLCGHLLQKKWELPLGCPYSALGALHWRVSLYPIRSRSPSPHSLGESPTAVRHNLLNNFC